MSGKFHEISYWNSRNSRRPQYSPILEEGNVYDHMNDRYTYDHILLSDLSNNCCRPNYEVVNNPNYEIIHPYPTNLSSVVYKLKKKNILRKSINKNSNNNNNERKSDETFIVSSPHKFPSLTKRPSPPKILPQQQIYNFPTTSFYRAKWLNFNRITSSIPNNNSSSTLSTVNSITSTISSSSIYSNLSNPSENLIEMFDKKQSWNDKGTSSNFNRYPNNISDYSSYSKSSSSMRSMNISLNNCIPLNNKEMRKIEREDKNDIPKKIERNFLKNKMRNLKVQTIPTDDVEKPKRPTRRIDKMKKINQKVDSKLILSNEDKEFIENIISKSPNRLDGLVKAVYHAKTQKKNRSIRQQTTNLHKNYHDLQEHVKQTGNHHYSNSSSISSSNDTHKCLTLLVATKDRAKNTWSKDLFKKMEKNIYNEIAMHKDHHLWQRTKQKIKNVAKTCQQVPQAVYTRRQIDDKTETTYQSPYSSNQNIYQGIKHSVIKPPPRIEMRKSVPLPSKPRPPERPPPPKLPTKQIKSRCDITRRKPSTNHQNYYSNNHQARKERVRSTNRYRH
ncbi:hypothetical protein SNEBB_004790 [Seison nebaliae]|nr:hypothetical protein SNEBB_004790 [Seison nebaliae]